MTAMSRDHGDYPIFCLDTICGPYGGSAMIAWLLAFLGFPPPAWDSLITSTGLARTALVG
jgi:hypothetical protein